MVWCLLKVAVNININVAGFKQVLVDGSSLDLFRIWITEFYV